MRIDPLLYQAARAGAFGRYRVFDTASITDALFVYLDGKPSAESIAVLDREYRVRPLVCLTEAWEAYIRKTYPEAQVYQRFQMKPGSTFCLEGEPAVPEGYTLADFEEQAFLLHPFSHGENYPDYETFRRYGSGAVVWYEGQIVASASSFLSYAGEVELDVSTDEAHRGKGLASACVAWMLQNCQTRGITVHWDAQNELSRHLAEKFGFEADEQYLVYWVV